MIYKITKHALNKLELLKIKLQTVIIFLILNNLTHIYLFKNQDCDGFGKPGYMIGF